MKQKKIIIGIIVFIIVIAAVAITAFCLVNKKKRVAHRPRTFRFQNVQIDGIDVSHYNVINWPELARNNKNIKFAYIKALEGKTHKDKKFTKNVRAARRNGIEVGAYLLYSNKSTPKQQYEAFIDIVDDTECDLIPAIDVESNKINRANHDEVAKHVAELSRLLERHYGKKPLIYCDDAVYRYFLRKRVPENHLWICNYRYIPTFNNHNGYVWQFSHRATVKGAKGQIDVNHLQGAMTMNMLRLKTK